MKTVILQTHVDGSQPAGPLVPVGITSTCARVRLEPCSTTNWRFPDPADPGTMSPPWFR